MIFSAYQVLYTARNYFALLMLAYFDKKIEILLRVCFILEYYDCATDWASLEADLSSHSHISWTQTNRAVIRISSLSSYQAADARLLAALAFFSSR